MVSTIVKIGDVMKLLREPEFSWENPEGGFDDCEEFCICDGFEICWTKIFDCLWDRQSQ